VYELHEIVNKLLGKSSGLSYCDVRERYEHFRARCTDDPKPRMLKPQTRKHNKHKQHKQHNGCTEPLYGKHSKCVLKIIPQDAPAESLSIDRQCIKQRDKLMQR
jgi:hypothetical protein